MGRLGNSWRAALNSGSYLPRLNADVFWDTPVKTNKTGEYTGGLRVLPFFTDS